MTRRLLLPLIWLAGLATILASSLTDEDPDDPPVAVTVDITLSTLDAPLEREVDTYTVELDDLLLTGDYSANQGDTLTVNQDFITLDNTSRFQITVTPKDSEELLDGNADFTVAAALDVGLGHDPAAGQFSVLLRTEDNPDGTTTIVTVTASGVDVVIGDGMTTSYSWSDFAAREDDNDEELNLRMASAAYNMIEAVLRTALLAEAIVSDVEDNKDTLEGMMNEALTLACSTGSGGGAGELSLFWTIDTAGSGSGEIGDGDGFEAVYDNCRDGDRYFDGIVQLDNYNPAADTGFSVFGIDTDLSNVYIANDPVDSATRPGPDSPRYSGALLLLYIESLATR